MRHLIDPMDLSVSEITAILDLAEKIIHNPEEYAHCCEGKVLATLFYEPSTRTRLSFESAMLHLGGKALGFSSPSSSSVSKGETVADTIRVVSCYADICAMRHPKEGAPTVASHFSGIPIINAGDGGHQHPTQTLTDLLTIRTLKGNLDHFTIGFCGDLKFGRTVHSLVKALSRYEGVNFIFISPDELKMPAHLFTEVLDPAGLSYRETASLEEVIGQLDVLYMTRVQQERFSDEEEYLRLRDTYILDTEKMALAKPDMIVLHPLPRVNEITPEVDNDPRAAYFKQVLCGRYVRMALIMTLLGVAGAPRLEEREKDTAQVVTQGYHCTNHSCITLVERGIPPKFVPIEGSQGNYKCLYCEHEAQKD